MLTFDLDSLPTNSALNTALDNLSDACDFMGEAFEQEAARFAAENNVERPGEMET